MQGDQNCKGWLLTCDQNRQKQALKDAYNFLTMYIEQEYDDLVAEAIQKKLKQQNKELSLETELKQSKKKENKLLFSIQTNVKCIIFVKINPHFNQIDPVLIVDKIMEDVYLRNKDITRYCHKILPVQKAFKAEHFKMLQVVDQLFNEKTQSNEVKSWFLNFKLRNNSKFNYKEILRECDKIATKHGHFADIYYPQWTLSIQITRHLMCICISEKYKEYNQYKLHKAVPKQQNQKRQIKQKQKQQIQHNEEKSQFGLRTQKELRQFIAKQKQSQPKENYNQEVNKLQSQNLYLQISQNKNYSHKEKNTQTQNTKLLQQKIAIKEDDVDLF